MSIDFRLTRRAFHRALLAGAGLGASAFEAIAQEKGKGPGALGPGANLGKRPIFPADNPWNQDISRAPVDKLSMAYLSSVGLDKPLHPDFGPKYRGTPNGIPYTVVSGSQPPVPVKFRYDDESDPGPYPIPPDAPIEGGPQGTDDRHVLVIDRDRWKVYELFNARPVDGGKSWEASSGAVFDLKSNAQRPAGWTSADAGGLPVFPGLARYEEAVTLGAIRHALRFTVAKTQRGYCAPARHFASKNTDPSLPPLGMRVRLKAKVDLRKFPPQARAVLQALKTYGMILADNGGDWFVSGAPDDRWSDDDLGAMKAVKVRDFEVVRTGDIVTR